MWATGWCRTRSDNGFTLLELLIVTVILGLFWSFAGLRVEGVLTEGDLGLAARRLSGEIRALRGRAAYSHQDQYLVFHMGKHLYWPTETRRETDESAFEWLNHEDDTIPEDAKKLPRGVFFEDVAVAGKQKKQEGIAEVRFFANGSVERCLIHIRDGEGRTFTLEVHPLTGRVEVHETYIDQTQA